MPWRRCRLSIDEQVDRLKTGNPYGLPVSRCQKNQVEPQRRKGRKVNAKKYKGLLSSQRSGWAFVIFCCWGLTAKPIIDICVESPPSPPLEEELKTLGDLGFENRGEACVTGRICNLLFGMLYAKAKN